LTEAELVDESKNATTRYGVAEQGYNTSVVGATTVSPNLAGYYAIAGTLSYRPA
jgi:hypothetical protein